MKLFINNPVTILLTFLLPIPNQPFDPKKKEMIEEFKKLHQKRKELLKGYTQSKAIFCSEVHR